MSKSPLQVVRASMLDLLAKVFEQSSKSPLQSAAEALVTVLET